MSSISSSGNQQCIISQAPILQLPTFLQINILTYLGDRDRSNSFSTCKHAHSLSKNSYVLQANRFLSSIQELAPFCRCSLGEQRTLAQLQNERQGLVQRLQFNPAIGGQAAPAQVGSVPTDEERKRMRDRLHTLDTALQPKACQFNESILRKIQGYVAFGNLQFHSYNPFTGITSNTWNRYIGSVSHVEATPEAKARLLQTSPLNSQLSIGDDHIYVCLPAGKDANGNPVMGDFEENGKTVQKPIVMVDGQPLTPRRIVDYFQNVKNSGKPIKLNIYWDKILEELGDKPIAAGEYFMPRGCLPGTKNQTYPKQLGTLAQTNAKIAVDWLQKVLEVHGGKLTVDEQVQLRSLIEKLNSNCPQIESTLDELATLTPLINRINDQKTPQELELKLPARYRVANIWQILVPSLLEFAQSGKADIRLFENEYGRSSTEVDGIRLDFGGFGSHWPDVDDDCDIADDDIGLGVVWPCGSS